MKKHAILLSLMFAGMVTFSSSLFAAEVNIYSYRQPDLIKPLLDAFEDKTGIKSNVLFLKKGMVERMKAEGKNSPADVILTTDISRLMVAKEAGVTVPLDDLSLVKTIPDTYRDPENHWFGITTRGRVVYASKERVTQDSIDYEDLVKPEWKGRICIRSGQHVYNVALFSSLIHHMGEEKAREWLKGLKANLARKPSGNDRAQAKGIFSGECDIGVGNTYYVGLMKTNTKNPEQKEWAKSMKVLFPNTDNRGTHVNISGMALAKHAPNKENALKLIGFLASEEAQKIYGAIVHEYPASEGVEPSDLVRSFGNIKPDTLPLATIAKNHKRASQLVDEVNFNDGPE